MSTEITPKEINDILTAFKADGEIVDEEDTYDAVYEFLV
jgi:hypothetical protein